MPRGTTTALVREAAHTLSVSERTVWRWLAGADNPDGLEVEYLIDDIIEAMQNRECLACGAPLPPASKDAPTSRSYCDGTCRQAAFRRRQARLTFLPGPPPHRRRPPRQSGTSRLTHQGRPGAARQPAAALETGGNR